jgi:hypothetical protein
MILRLSPKGAPFAWAATVFPFTFSSSRNGRRGHGQPPIVCGNPKNCLASRAKIEGGPFFWSSQTAGVESPRGVTIGTDVTQGTKDCVMSL